MKTIQEKKDEVSKVYGYKNWDDFWDNLMDSDKLVNQVIIEFARQACKEQRRLCAESADLKQTVQYSMHSTYPVSKTTIVDKQSILKAPSPC